MQNIVDRSVLHALLASESGELLQRGHAHPITETVLYERVGLLQVASVLGRSCIVQFVRVPSGRPAKGAPLPAAVDLTFADFGVKQCLPGREGRGVIVSCAIIG